MNAKRITLGVLATLAGVAFLARGVLEVLVIYYENVSNVQVYAETIIFLALGIIIIYYGLKLSWG